MVIGYTEKYIKGITDGAKRKAETRVRKGVKSVIRNLKHKVKKAAKRGNTDYLAIFTSKELCAEVKAYFTIKGFRCTHYESDGELHLTIAW